ncbi:periplasmic solute binding protein [Candidatus Magnetoovum chiemensis]|nr:periplasmic solute binding protein [Candidatus Magnetoovum chiemensis]
MRKHRLTLIFLIFSMLAANNVQAADKVKVTASFYPLAHFASQVCGDYADVVNITPPGVEPHDFEPSPKDLKNVWQSTILIFNDESMNPWAERIHKELEKKGITVIEMAKQLDFLKPSHNEAAEEHEDEHEHHHGMYDPHFWLDPVMAQKAVDIIKNALISADPKNKQTYENNSAAYIAKLVELDKQFSDGLKECKSRNIIVSHDAFNYLAKRYNLTVHSISGISPEDEPSPRKLSELTKLIGELKIRYVFFETLVNPKFANTLASETGVKTLVLDTIEGLTQNQLISGDTYLSVMNKNLTNLRTALECK